LGKLVCKYTGCHNGIDGKSKTYETCPACIERKPWKAYGCCFEHGCMYQNEVAIARGERIPYPDFIERMLQDGVITEDTNVLV
jgi:hypothetical protein